MQVGTEGRYLTVDPTVFPRTKYVKNDGHTILPSLEFKTRKALMDGHSAADMLRQQNAKTRPLLVNWDKAYVWDSKERLKKDGVWMNLTLIKMS